MANNEKLILVNVASLVEDDKENPIVILHDRENNRLLPIWIGDPEAHAISIVLNKTQVPRPLTHRLLLNIVQALGAKLEKVVISELKNNAYFAYLHIQMNKEIIEIDSRPSDAIAIALEAQAPIFVAEEVMKKGGQENPFSFGGTVNNAQKNIKVEFKKEEAEKLSELLHSARQREIES